jgi:signal transduction histidine kinase
MYAGTPVARLVSAVQELSNARNVERITALVCSAAREVTGADGVTFVPDGESHDASGAETVVVVPVRGAGAIAACWHEAHKVEEHERWMLTALADASAIALAHVRRTEHATMLVHDLRSPANGIMLAAKLRLRAKDTPDSARRHWQNVHTAAETIHRMAMNLLDVTRSEDGAFVLRASDIALPELLAEVVDLMSPLAASREQQIMMAANLASPIVRCDSELVRRVLQNLLDNALRYTPDQGTVVLGVRDGDGHVELRVTDQGPGVPAEERRAIFEKYTRSSTRDDLGGHGLGLAFCRLAVEHHGGTIDVEAAEPNGSAFVVRLPRPS